MNNRYSHLLSPIRIGNVVLKNRMISTNSMPHYLMGPEDIPQTPWWLTMWSGQERCGTADLSGVSILKGYALPIRRSLFEHQSV